MSDERIAKKRSELAQSAAEHLPPKDGCTVMVRDEGYDLGHGERIAQIGLAATRNPAAFWSSLTPAQALALLKAAPKVAGPWVDDDGRSDRFTPKAEIVASVLSAVSGRFFPFITDEAQLPPNTSLDDAKKAADADLLAKGWVLVDD